MTATLSEISYSKELIGFIDVLGFREMVTKKDETNKERIRTYYNISNYIRETWQKIPEKMKIKSLVISDSIIVTLPVSDEIPIEQLKHFCIAICGLQFHLAKNNIWTRGAITAGEIHFEPNSNLIVGPGFIKAYELEKKIAKYPRIILDSTLVALSGCQTVQEFTEKVNANIEYENWKGDVVFDWLPSRKTIHHVSQDIPMFLDYLEILFQNNPDFGNPQELIYGLLSSRLKEDIQHFEKYRWVVDYLLLKCNIKIPKAKSNYVSFKELLSRL